MTKLYLLKDIRYKTIILSQNNTYLKTLQGYTYGYTYLNTLEYNTFL